VVDSAQAWRRFHERVNSPAPGPVGEVGPGYRAEGSVTRPLAAGRGELLRLAARRRSSEPGAARAVSFDELSALLRAAYGRGAPDARRSVPSGGALYPLVVHALLSAELGPLEPGLWWFDPEAGAVELVDRAVAEVESLVLREEIADGLLAGGQPVVFVSADVERGSAKYQNKAYPLALMEAGAAMQNAYLAATELDLPIRAVAGIDDRASRRALGLPDGAVPLLALLLGS
jgi:SagB-type dehydrogenase family enzyme